MRSLDGCWNLKFDAEHAGFDACWFETPPADTEKVAVPASVNEQFMDRDKYTHMDWIWYFHTFSVAPSWKGKRIVLRFGSACYRAEVFVNGQRLGTHEGGYMPFEFDVTDIVRFDAENRLTVRVDNLLDECTIPQGRLDPSLGGVAAWRVDNFPDVHYDFFPYMGIQRSVTLSALNETRIENAFLTTTALKPKTKLNVKVSASAPAGEVQVCIDELGFQAVEKMSGSAAQLEMALSEVTPWSPQNPKLYKVIVRLLNDGEVVDEYSIDFGFRTIEVQGEKVLLNGEPLFLRGFGRHEDAAISGRGLNLPFMVKDYEMMKWIGANSFRTTHYPYSEEMLALADQLGIIVISETAANTLSMKAVADPKKKAKLLKEHQRQVAELMERDYNFASVLFWSLGNECETYYEEGDDYFPELVKYARTLDESRPITQVVNGLDAEPERIAHLFDVLMLNTYPAWYVKCGKYEEIDTLLRPFLEGFYAKYKKPILISEFGADSIPGLHSEYNLMWSEEFQFEMLRRVIDIAEDYPFVFGTHVWNLCDFRVGQHVGRIINNWKGVFTRDRTPKMAAHLLRERWKVPRK